VAFGIMDGNEPQAGQLAEAVRKVLRPRSIPLAKQRQIDRHGAKQRSGCSQASRVRNLVRDGEQQLPVARVFRA
jgi:hypothetical protein